MTTTATPSYGSAGAMTITLASLATSSTLVAGRAGTAADNTSDLAIDAIVQAQIMVGTTPTANTQIELWAYGTADGTVYGGAATGTDANLTPTDKSTMRLLEIIPVPVTTSNVAYISGSHSIQNAFGGTMPRKWGIFVVHNTGVNLNSTGGNHTVKYTVVKYASA